MSPGSVSIRFALQRPIRFGTSNPDGLPDCLVGTWRSSAPIRQYTRVLVCYFLANLTKVRWHIASCALCCRPNILKDQKIVFGWSCEYSGSAVFKPYMVPYFSLRPSASHVVHPNIKSATTCVCNQANIRLNHSLANHVSNIAKPLSLKLRKSAFHSHRKIHLTFDPCTIEHKYVSIHTSYKTIYTRNRRLATYQHFFCKPIPLLGRY